MLAVRFQMLVRRPSQIWVRHHRSQTGMSSLLGFYVVDKHRGPSGCSWNKTTTPEASPLLKEITPSWGVCIIIHNLSSVIATIKGQRCPVDMITFIMIMIIESLLLWSLVTWHYWISSVLHYGRGGQYVVCCPKRSGVTCAFLIF